MRQPAQRVEADRCPQVKLTRGGGVWAHLTYYAPGVMYQPHRHDHLQISTLLAGAFHESDGDVTLDLLGGEVGIKPPGFWHDDAYGIHGALVLAVNVDPALTRGREFAARSMERWGWNRRGIPAPADLWAQVRGRPDGFDLAALARLAAPRQGPAPRVLPAPAWLREARRLIEETPSAPIRDIARQAGAHRVVLSRVFRRHFSIAPSEYRRRVRVARAVERCIIGQESLCDVAHGAGFADQAHLCRELRAFVGLQPSALRTLFAV